MIQNIPMPNKPAKYITVFLLAALVYVLAVFNPVSALAGFGGYISEKALGDGTNEILYIGRGTDELTVIGSGPFISAIGATSTSSGGTISVTMYGTVGSLNGLPRADTWFVWGYAPGGMTNTTAVVSIVAAGTQTVTINPTVGQTVYYQFYAGSDSASSSSVGSILAGGGHGASYVLMHNVLPIVIAAIILIVAFAMTRNPIVALLATIIGLVAYYIVMAMLSTL